jgi:hypothetical protein
LIWMPLREPAPCDISLIIRRFLLTYRLVSPQSTIGFSTIVLSIGGRPFHCAHDGWRWPAPYRAMPDLHPFGGRMSRHFRSVGTPMPAPVHAFLPSHSPHSFLKPSPLFTLCLSISSLRLLLILRETKPLENFQG